MILLVLVLPLFCILSSRATNDDISGLSKGAIYTWDAELKVLDPSTGTYSHYWSARHFMHIVESKKSGDTLTVRMAYSTYYMDVVKLRYAKSDKSDRIANHRYGSLKRTYDLTTEKYVFILEKERWGFYIDFPFSPFMVFAVQERGFRMFLEGEYTKGYVSGMYMDRGILFDTWDIVLGTRRKVYYLEIYYSCMDLNLNETELGEMSVLEVNVEIDKELGIVLRLRYFWRLADKMFELMVELSDTNMFMKHRFTMTIVSLFIVLISIWVIVRYYKERRRRRIIRI